LTFWTKQLEIVQKALGHKFPGKIIFDNIILSDETAEKRLLIDLVDRDIISAEAVKYNFGFDPFIENSKVKSEKRDRKAKRMPPKAGPYHMPEKSFAYKKIALQAGDITPSEVGVSLKEKDPTQIPRIEVLHDQKKELTKIQENNKIKQMAGRPDNVVETEKRKKKPNFRPQTGKGYNDLFLWSTKAYEYVTDNLSETILQTFNKKNFRQLTNEESKEAERFKFNVFAQLEPLSELTSTRLAAAIESNGQIDHDINNTYEEFLNKYISLNGREPNISEERQMRVLSYTGVKFQDFSDFGV
jgi:hypothetical protein